MGRLATSCAALGCVLVAAFLAVQARDEGRVRAAAEAGRAGDLTAAVAGARRVRVTAAAGRAARIEAAALYGLGRRAEADRALAVAVAHAPNDWSLRRDRALLLLAAGDRAGAAAQLRRAHALNPLLRLPPGFRAR